MRESENRLIRKMPRRQREQLLARCTLVPLKLGQVVYTAGVRSDFVYFPVGGLVSLSAKVPRGASLDMGVVGLEGMLGVHLTLGVAISPFQALVQGAGSAWRLGRAAFRREWALNLPLRECLGRYLYVTLTQTASSAACLHSHRLGPRLARYLLMAHDRIQIETFSVTHALLAGVLGVRRVGVTLAAGLLQEQGLIRYSRGSLTVLNRRGLELTACACYATDGATYARAMN